ncbi:MAG: STAS domain-containing protein [Candidatus Binatia bacterium]
MSATEPSITDPFSIRLVADESGARLVLEGALGVAEAAELHRTALDALAHGGNVALEWSGVESIDTAVAQLLIALAAALRNDERRLDLPAPPAGVEAFLHRTALRELLFA